MSVSFLTIYNTNTRNVSFIFSCQRHKSDVNPKKVWEKPTVVPECLSTRLEILKWRDYEGTEHEKDMVGYILANATFLQRATFSTKDRNQCDSRFSELQSLERVSEICEFVFD